MTRNWVISSSVILRALSDVSASDYGNIIETMVTTISLNSPKYLLITDCYKVRNSSLKNCLHETEFKSCGS